MTRFGFCDRVRDQITGFEGVVVAVTQWFTGVNTYRVRSMAGGGEHRFEECSLELLEVEAITLGEVPEQKVIDSLDRSLDDPPVPA